MKLVVVLLYNNKGPEKFVWTYDGTGRWINKGNPALSFSFYSTNWFLRGRVLIAALQTIGEQESDGLRAGFFPNSTEDEDVLI